MRISRKRYLSQSGGIVHKFWRAHNKDFLLVKNTDKESYLHETFFATKHKSLNNEVKVQAYCIMNNHSHQLISYKASSDALSSFMRIAHSRFGQKYNKIYNRQGPVAYDRPKTPLVQPNEYHQMRVHFYIEANPLRAGITKNLKTYLYSSFRFYAYGIKDCFSEKLCIPQWYLKLGKNPTERQLKYRSYFYKYLKESNKKTEEFNCCKFIGDSFWILFQKNLMQSDFNSSKPPD